MCHTFQNFSLFKGLLSPISAFQDFLVQSLQFDLFHPALVCFCPNLCTFSGVLSDTKWHIAVPCKTKWCVSHFAKCHYKMMYTW